jgi:pyrroloquinoline-quinone synthase
LFLARAVGLDVEEVRSLKRVVPAVRYACDAYVELVRTRSLVEAVASSLTEHFAPDIMRTRVAAWEKHYPWVDSAALAYFRSRVPRATRDAEEALAFVVEHATTRALQDACTQALVDKCRILWAMLDAVAESSA